MKPADDEPSQVSARDASNYQLVTLDPDHVAATWGNLVLLVWRFRTLVEPYRAGIRLIEKQAKAHPKGVGVMQIVETEAIPPDNEVRKLFRVAMDVPGIGHFSVTHEGTGFKAAAVRAIVWSVHSLARPNYPHAVHDSLAAATSWVALHNRALGRKDDPQPLERAIQDMRRRHRERYPSPP